MESNVSRWMPLEYRHVNNSTHIFLVPELARVCLPYLMWKGPKTSIPQCQNGGVFSRRWDGKSAIRCAMGAALNLRQIMHRSISCLTLVLPPTATYPSFLIHPVVIFLPWCSVDACRCPRSASPTSPSGITIGYFRPNVISASRSLPPARMSPFSMWGDIAIKFAIFLSRFWREIISLMPPGNARCCISSSNFSVAPSDSPSYSIDRPLLGTDSASLSMFCRTRYHHVCQQFQFEFSESLRFVPGLCFLLWGPEDRLAIGTQGR